MPIKKSPFGGGSGASLAGGGVEVPILFSGKSKWGLNKWGLKVLVHNCPRLPTIVVILRRKFPLERGPKVHTIVDNCVPPFESPHLDVPDLFMGAGFFFGLCLCFS